MIIRIADIPPEGRHLEFEIDQNSLNFRVDAARTSAGEQSLPPPEYLFVAAPLVNITLDLEGSTVMLEGSAVGRYRTTCARCAEEASVDLSVPLRIVLKPSSARSRPNEEDEDLQLGFYDGQEVDCGSIAEEFLVLALPFSVLCRPDCKGLCSLCGTNLNKELCQCKPTRELDERFSVLQGLKIQ